ncbi:MAG: hypothetical protein ACRD0K_09700 [Egibacteraceae bacterium]
MDWIVEFFRTIPGALSALWEFGNGWAGVAVTAGSAAAFALFLVAAHRLRDTYGWVSALCGAMASFIAIWWALGILPSAWVYFVDGSKNLLRDQMIPGQIVIGDFTVAANFYSVVRDAVVAAEQVVALVAFGAVGIYVQKKYPRTLAEGEQARPQSGGYK